MVVAPFVLFPFTKTLFLAFDLVFRPRRAPECSSTSRGAASEAGAWATSPRSSGMRTTARSGSTCATASRIRTRRRTPRRGSRTRSAATPETQFAIEVEGEAVGGVGLFLQADVERYSAEIGYWLGEALWGRGLATAVVRGFTDYAFDAFDLCRIYANVFEWNPGSCRVLEKAGYVLEGRLRRRP